MVSKKSRTASFRGRPQAGTRNPEAFLPDLQPGFRIRAKVRAPE